MSDDDQQIKPQANGQQNAPRTEDGRDLLLQQARSFLTSPQVRLQDAAAKRHFLVEKGLNTEEIDRLLNELPIEPPAVPPRTYPRPPSSNLPNLLIGSLRIFSCIAGGSAALLLLYHRFLLPRITTTLQARHAIKGHQKNLLTRLVISSASLRATQTDVFPNLASETREFTGVRSHSDCRDLDELLTSTTDIPPDNTTLLRCALKEFAAKGEKVDAEALFDMIEMKFPHFSSKVAKHELWDTLSSNPVFQSEVIAGGTVWSYHPSPGSQHPAPAEEAPIISSLVSLSSALRPPSSSSNSSLHSALHHTLQSLADLTGYITTQTYGITSFRAAAFGLQSSLSPEEEDIRREIRALKGLVLNRRTFAPAISRTLSTAGPP